MKRDPTLVTILSNLAPLPLVIIKAREFDVQVEGLEAVFRLSAYRALEAHGLHQLGDRTAARFLLPG